MTLEARFVKEYSVPIPVPVSPYFEYYLDLFEEHFQSRTKFEGLKKTIKDLGNEQKFFSETKNFTNSFIDTISKLPQYKEFIEDDFKKFIFTKKVKGQELYAKSNVGQYFISIDMSNANFNALNFFDPELVLNCKSYKELAGKFTKLDYLINSKQLRQVIFGNLNPKRQQTIQMFMMNQVVEKLEKYFDISRFTSSTSDEIVLTSTKDSIDKDIEIIQKNVESFMKVEGFKLNCVESNKVHGYVKEMILGEKKGKVEFKGTPIYYFPQVYKKYFGLKVNEYDKKFIFEGQVASFDHFLFE